MSRDNVPLETQRLDSLHLPHVEAWDPEEQDSIAREHPGRPVYDDSVDVEVGQSRVDRPYANLTFVPAGPVGGFTLLGFGPEELRRLGRFLIESADDLEARFGTQGNKEMSRGDDD